MIHQLYSTPSRESLSHGHASDAVVQVAVQLEILRNADIEPDGPWIHISASVLRLRWMLCHWSTSNLILSHPSITLSISYLVPITTSGLQTQRPYEWGIEVLAITTVSFKSRWVNPPTQVGRLYLYLCTSEHWQFLKTCDLSFLWRYKELTDIIVPTAKEDSEKGESSLYSPTGNTMMVPWTWRDTDSLRMLESWAENCDTGSLRNTIGKQADYTIMIQLHFEKQEINIQRNNREGTNSGPSEDRVCFGVGSTKK